MLQQYWPMSKYFLSIQMEYWENMRTLILPKIFQISVLIFNEELAKTGLVSRRNWDIINVKIDIYSV